MDKIKMGFALCGSFCTYSKVLPVLHKLADEYDILPIMSEISAATDTRFGLAGDFIREIEELTGKKIITGIADAEPIGPQKLLDVLVVAPCTGNTLAKISHAVTDSGVAMACKAHLRNNRPLVLAPATNDALSASAENIGRLLVRRNVYFVPMYQDDPRGKPCSMVSDMELIGDTVRAALEGRQIQPLLLGPRL
ncbi:MAG: dipicolinate synthase subunit B [Oscillospiraceae bacterium]|jgi:dipicolinate synthase subunit B